jgi:hypothetical protein
MRRPSHVRDRSRRFGSITKQNVERGWNFEQGIGITRRCWT